MKIQILVDVKKPEQKYINIKYQCELAEKTDFIDLSFPVWTPGSYLVREYQSQVEAFEVYGHKGKLDFEKMTKSKWRVYLKGQKNFQLRYKIYANDLSVRGVYSDHEMVFINSCSTFFYIDNGIHYPVSLKFDLNKEQKLALSKKVKSGKYNFDNFDELYDTPILIANALEKHSFKVGQTNFHLAIFGEYKVEQEKLIKDLKNILQKQMKMFKGHPCSDYLFQLIFHKNEFGGLEHSCSSTNIFDGTKLGQKKSYQRFLSLLSHEHFHLWNVKRIRPQALGPFDYSKENYTRELWIAEGVTSYYDDHFVFRSGSLSNMDYLNILSENIKRYENQKGSRVNSLSDSSFDAWIRFYRQNENSINTTVSYYLKGGLVMMLLDFAIIKETKAKNSLDDVMLALWKKYQKNPDTGISRDDFFKEVEKILGKSSKGFIRDYIDGVKKISWQNEFKDFGIDVKNLDKQDSYYLGVILKKTNSKVLIAKVMEDSPVYKSALQVDDEILAIDHIRIEKTSDIDVFLNKKKLHVIFARRGKVFETELILEKKKRFLCSLELKKKLTKEQKRFQEKFLRKK